MRSLLRPVAALAAFLCLCGCLSSWLWASTAGAAQQGEGSPPAAAVPQASSSQAMVSIPGPLRSFLRMAGISQKASLDEVLPLLAQEVDKRGYVDGKPTEFLILLRRYIQQARELSTLAGPQAVIRVSSCEEAKPLMTILGYRPRQTCGPNVALQTAEPDRAFLTIDSGFPLVEFEQALQSGKPFVLPYASTQVPLLFTASDWTAGESNAGDVIDSLIRDPGLARLYSAMDQMDSETALALRQSPGLKKLAHYANVLDFYGSHIYIRSGHVTVPGGALAEPAWKDLVGVSADNPAEFVVRLAGKDEGWLAAFFDALSRVSPAQQAYFAEPRHLKRFYEALRGSDVGPGPAKPVFRPDPGFSLLLTRLQLEDGKPHIPGDLETWKAIFRHKPDSHRARDCARRASHWNDPDQMVEGLMTLSREYATEGPLQIFLTLNEIDRGRTGDQRLTPQTVHLLADKFPRFGDQYIMFSEFHGLNNASITHFLSTAEELDRIAIPNVRANAIGIFQANIGFWQILARQGQISDVALNDSWEHVISPFAKLSSSAQLFDAGRTSLRELLRTASGNPDLSQDELIALLAGPDQNTTEGREVKEALATKIRSVLEAQRLISLDTLFALGDGLNDLAKGKQVADKLVPLAAELREFEMPRPIFTATEKTEVEREVSDTRHATLQTKTNLAKVIKSGSTKEWAEARGRLSPFLRDTLVGLNYAYYEPPGGQMLANNALFVRSHDYLSEFGTGGEQPWKTPRLVSSNGTHLAGSLVDLPYALAWVEQDFIVPENVQSLIWEDLVPSLLTSAVLPRWWSVSPIELHAVALYQRAGEELLPAAAKDEKLRARAMEILSERMLPQRAGQIERALRNGHPEQVLPQMAPAETFYLAAEFRRRFRDDANAWGPAGKELDAIGQRSPAEVSWERLSAHFGVPHPALAHSYARELLNVKPFPTFQDYSSRLLAECWDSNNLYWARLADEKGYPPVMLNRLVPELTHRMVEKLFATNLEDWPAILRAMQDTGEEFRHGKIALLPANGGNGVGTAGETMQYAPQPMR